MLNSVLSLQLIVVWKGGHKEVPPKNVFGQPFCQKEGSFTGPCGFCHLEEDVGRHLLITKMVFVQCAHSPPRLMSKITALLSLLP